MAPNSSWLCVTCVVCSNKHQWIRHMGIIRWWYQLLLSAMCLQWKQLQLCSSIGHVIGGIPCWNHRRRCHIRTFTNADLQDNTSFSTWISSCWCYRLCKTKDPATVPALNWCLNQGNLYNSLEMGTFYTGPCPYIPMASNIITCCYVKQSRKPGQMAGPWTVITICLKTVQIICKKKSAWVTSKSDMWSIWFLDKTE